MKRRVAVLLVVEALVFSSGCEGQRAPTGSPAAAIDGRVVYFQEEVRYFVVDADGSGQPTPFAPGKNFELRNLPPDGSRFAVVGPNADGLLVGGTVGLDGTGFRLFEADDPSLNLACGVWAPKGRMACEGWDDIEPSRAGIYTVGASDGSDVRRLTRRRDVPCEYSPDGTELAFVRIADDDVSGALMVMDAEGGEPRSLLRDVRLAGIGCDWSPDGESILTASDDGSLLIVTPDGVSSRFTGRGITGYAFGAVWSPDGEYILFDMSLADAQFDVYAPEATAPASRASRTPIFSRRPRTGCPDTFTTTPSASSADRRNAAKARDASRTA